MDVIGKLLQGKKLISIIASCDELFTCFLFFFDGPRYILCAANFRGK